MKVNIENISANIAQNSIDIEDKISGRSTAYFTVLDNPNHFNQGLPVQINDYSNEMIIKNGYYPPYSNKAKVSYIKGRSYETVNLFDLETHYVGITIHAIATIDSYDFSLNTITINNISSDGNSNDYARIYDVSVVNGQQYTITYKADGTENWNRILIYDGLADVLIIDGSSHVNGTYSVTFVATSDVIDLILYANSNVGKIQTITYSEIILNEGDTALPYEPYFKGLKSVGGTIEGQTLPTLRGLETVYDECKDNKITRKFVEVNLWEYGDVVLRESLINTYGFTFNNFGDVYGLIYSNEIGSFVNKFVYEESGDYRRFYYYSNFVMYVEKSIIDDIIARTDLLYEWKLQEDVILGVNYEWKLQEEVESTTTNEYYINPNDDCASGYTKTILDPVDPINGAVCTKQTTVTTWEDVSPEQTQWSETQPSASSGYRWVKTGNEQNITEWRDVLPLQTKLSATQPAGDSTHQWVETGYTTYAITEVEALLIYLEEEKIQGVFELAKYTEEIVQSIYINMVYGQPLTIDSIDTTIKVLLDYYLLFAGFIDIASESIVGTKGNRQLNHRVECKDNTYLLDKRIIARTYQNMLCGDIVKDIINDPDLLGAEGITEGIIQDGVLMEEVVFNYINTKKASFKLAEASNFIVFIDYERRLHFRARDYDINPIPLLESDVMHDHKQINVDIGNQEYRNKQYIKGGKDLTDTQYETFSGDGVNRNFTLTFPCGEKPTILDNGALVNSADIGIRGIDENKKWYWSKGNNIINQDDNEEVIPTGTNVRVEYKGLYDIVVAMFDKAEIDTRAELEHNSGIIEKIAEEPDNNSILTSIDSGNAKLEKYAINGKKITCYTRRRDIESGQTIRVTLPSFNINEDMLVQGVNISQQDTVTWYQLTLIAGPEQQTFYDMIDNATTPNISVIRENIDEAQAVPIEYDFTKTWLEADPVNIFYEVYPSDTLYPSTTLYPMFEVSDRVKYMEVMSDSTVLIRLKPIKQITEDREIKSIFYIKTKEANELVTSFKFYGGSQATEEIGSGVLIDTQTLAVARTKTNLEIFIVTKIDVKGW